MAEAAPPTSSGREAGTGGLRADARSLARLTGLGYFPLAFVGRLPFAMMIVGVLTLVVSARGSVAEAGIVAAAAGIGTAICGPLSGALADRIGQRSVLCIAGAASILAAGALLLVAASAPLGVVALVATVVGGTTPQVAPFSRSRLVGLSGAAPTESRRARALSLVMSYESAADEASFVLGPVFVGVLTATVAPWAPLVLSMLLTVAVVLPFALHPTAASVPASADADASGSIVPFRRSFPGEVRVLIVAALLVGAVFGALLTAVTAFMAERGHADYAGVVYGAMSLGAIAIALGTALIPRGFGLRARWIVFGVVALAACTGLLVVGTAPAVAAVLALAGVGVGATLVGIFSLGALAAPAGRSTTVLTTLQSALVVGQALAGAVGGALAGGLGATAGFGLAAALAGAVLAVGAVDRALYGPISAGA